MENKLCIRQINGYLSILTLFGDFFHWLLVKDFSFVPFVEWFVPIEFSLHLSLYFFMNNWYASPTSLSSFVRLPNTSSIILQYSVFTVCRSTLYSSQCTVTIWIEKGDSSKTCFSSIWTNFTTSSSFLTNLTTSSSTLTN